ncbi:MAG: PhoH family protein [Planctomycetes bacterium]|nr:PhoH family protein [Planctomycetota bacterium]
MADERSARSERQARQAAASERQARQNGSDDVTLDVAGHDEAQLLFGPNDRNIRLVRERFGVDVVLRDLRVLVRGDARDDALVALRDLLTRARAKGQLDLKEVEAALGPRPTPGEQVPADEPRVIEGVKLKTPGQRRYVKAIRDNDVVFSVGPAGTGKTFLAVLMAVRALKSSEVQRIVLCRPAVEAGEKLGFLPGDASAKVNPYMRPLYDALNGILDFETVKKYQEREVIEVAPLAFMRGRTLNHAFIILDEAQNTTKAQMKMFLTRMGEGSKIVVTGDVTQIDLPRGTTSGLVHAQSILRNVAGIAHVTLGNADIVRHPLVWKIVERYEGQRDRR